MKTTIIILTYKHERFICEALQSALAQTRPAEEIIVIDDASPDATFEKAAAFVHENGSAPFRLIRNETNLGLAGSFNRAIAASTGEVIFAFAGDDVSHPGRLESCLNYLSSRPATFALFTNADVIDESSRRAGRLDNCAGMDEPASLSLNDVNEGEYFLRSRSSLGATAAYRAAVFRDFAPLRLDIYTEDAPVAFRAMLLGACDFLPVSLVAWRKHGDNMSHGAGAPRDAKMARHYRRCEAMIDQMLADAAEWTSRNSPTSGLEKALKELRFQKARWALWSVAHEDGMRIRSFTACLSAMRKQRPSWATVLSEAWLPLIKMLTPFFIQRILVGLRKKIWRA